MRSVLTVTVVAVAAFVAAGAALAAEGGVLVWHVLLSVGILRDAGCPDVVVSGVAGLCVRPTSLVVTSIATTALAALLGGSVGYLVLRRARTRRAAR
jgi:hypothetical protein